MKMETHVFSPTRSCVFLDQSVFDHNVVLSRFDHIIPAQERNGIHSLNIPAGHTCLEKKEIMLENHVSLCYSLGNILWGCRSGRGHMMSVLRHLSHQWHELSGKSLGTIC